MKGLNKIKKCWKQLMLVLAMFLSISASTLTQANALNATLTWGQEIHYPSWLGNWSTKMCYINGSLAYCLEASKNTPAEGNYAGEIIQNNDALNIFIHILWLVMHIQVIYMVAMIGTI